MELRCPDPACNPYLTFAVLLQAGLEGIEKGYELPEPMEKNLYHLSGEERRRLGVEQLPESLGEAIEMTAESELVLRTLGEHMFNRYVEIKRQEWDDYRVQVTQLGAGPLPVDPVGAGSAGTGQAIGRAGDRCQCSACSRCPNELGWRGGDLAQQREHAERLALVLLLAASAARGAAAPARRSEPPGGDRRVLEVLAPRDQRFAVRGGREEAAVLGVGEARDQRRPPARAPARTSAPRRSLRTARAAPPAGRRGPRGRPSMLRARRRCRCAAAGRRSSRSSRSEELRAGDGGVGVARPPSSAAPASASAAIISAFQAVRRLSSAPGRARRSRAAEQPRADTRRASSRRRALARGPPARSAPARDGGGRRSCPPRSRRARRSRRPRPRRAARAARATRPHVEAPLDALGVGVERRVEAALGPAHLAQRPVERVAADLPQALLAGGLPSRAGRRARAARCRRASSRSAAPSRWRRRCSARSRRRAGRGCRRRPSPRKRLAERRISRSPRAASRNSSDRRLGELRRAAEPAVDAGRTAARRFATASSSALCCERLGGRASARRRRTAARAAARRPRGSPRALSRHASPIACSTCVHAGIPWRGLGREVGAAVERQLLGREEHVQRPAAVAGHALHRLHVERVDVRALLAVDLHADELLVHQRAPCAGPRRTRAPSRGTSGRRSSRSRRAAACRSARARASASAPRAASRRGCRACWRR